MKHPGQAIMIEAQTKKALFDTLLCSAGFALFAYLIPYPFPLKTAAFIPLAMAAYIISRNVNRSQASSGLLFRDVFSLKMLAYCIIGFQMGVAGAMYYRGSFGMPVLPAIVRSFTFVAIGIGIMEELVFRGFIQGRLSKFNPGFAIVFAAFAHTSYKACLFLSPAAQHQQSIMLLYTWSFGVFILIGLLRYYSKSILPAIIVHAVFDFIAYAENTQAPWWVW